MKLMTTAHLAVALALLQPQTGRAQGPGDLDAPIKLKPTLQLPEVVPDDQRAALPAVVQGQRISGRPDLETTVEGAASLRRGDTVIHADRLAYQQPEDLVHAEGKVRVNRAGDTYEGPELALKLETFEGFFSKPHYRLLRGGEGDAQRIDFVSSAVSVARNATYSTCRREDVPGWTPAWMLSATTFTSDKEEDVGVATDARLSLWGLETPPIPSLSFPLGDKRKSGFLPPVFGVDSINGFDLTVPYYWNIAPQRDATFYPNVMSRRGINLGSEFRYLEDDYSGESRLDYMPHDGLVRPRYLSRFVEASKKYVKKRDNGEATFFDQPFFKPPANARWGIWARHQQTFDAKPLGLDSLTGVLGINRVSDDDYWRDFTRTPSITQRLLANDASLNWVKGDWSGAVRTLRYQTLKDESSPIVPPYDRMPQITAAYNKSDFHGFDVALDVDHSRFRADPLTQKQPNGERNLALGSISRPFLTAGTFITPKAKLHATSYELGPQFRIRESSRASRVVPTLSLDSGLVFERETKILQKSFLQTLEPRALYVYTPYRDQDALPVYDTATNDAGAATFYSENAFLGHDRISDASQLTLGVASRLIDPDNGIEALRVDIAQRLRFTPQRVQLPGVAPVGEGWGELLLAAQVNLSSKWSVSSGVQYDSDDRRATRNTLNLRYSPSMFRTLSAAYRFRADRSETAKDGNESIDVGWQFPIGSPVVDREATARGSTGNAGKHRWYSVGRLNYDARDRRMSEAMIGLEYDGCCHVARVALERKAIADGASITRLLFQLELVGLSSIGSSLAQRLSGAIPRYASLRQPVSAPSRFSNYD